MWKKILLGVVLFIVALFGLVMWATSGLTDTASAFFNKVKAHDYKTAYYGYLSDDFKGNVPLEKFKLYMERNRLDQFKEINWGNREVENSKGKLEGILLMPDGSNIPISVMFVKAEDGWKIYAVTKPAAGLQETQDDKATRNMQKPSVPPTQIYMRLAKMTVEKAVTAFKSRDTDTFYDSISDLWKSQIDPKKFHQMYAPLMKPNVDLTPLIHIEPKEEKPAFIDKDNFLNVTLIYPTDNIKIYFRLAYVNENGQWKLAGMYISGK